MRKFSLLHSRLGEGRFRYLDLHDDERQPLNFITVANCHVVLHDFVIVALVI